MFVWILLFCLVAIAVATFWGLWSESKTTTKLIGHFRVVRLEKEVREDDPDKYRVILNGEQNFQGLERISESVCFNQDFWETVKIGDAFYLEKTKKLGKFFKILHNGSNVSHELESIYSLVRG